MNMTDNTYGNFLRFYAFSELLVMHVHVMLFEVLLADFSFFSFSFNVCIFIIFTSLVQSSKMKLAYLLQLISPMKNIYQSYDLGLVVSAETPTSVINVLCLLTFAWRDTYLHVVTRGSSASWQFQNLS